MSDDEREIENDLDSEVSILFTKLDTNSMSIFFYQNEDDLSGGANLSHLSEHEKRAHHNALERKRRDHIKDSFSGLKDAIPTLQVLKQAKKLKSRVISRLKSCKWY